MIYRLQKFLMSRENSCGYVYLLIEREFINANQQVYKIGRTGQNCPWERFKNYPKQSQFIFFFSVNNYKKIKQNIKKKIKYTNLIIHRKDIGEEYFEGNINIFIEIFNQHCKNEINEFTNQSIKSKKVIDAENIKKIRISLNVSNKGTENNVTESHISLNVSNKETENVTESHISLNVSNKETENNVTESQISLNVSNKETENNVTESQISLNVSNKETENNVTESQISLNVVNKETENNVTERQIGGNPPKLSLK